ncbi:MAG: hypothetical protein HQ578_07860, partial [Chloroflexi bacterium]|nr:hypothetical protein [Chloroflexota bacterium]
MNDDKTLRTDLDEICSAMEDSSYEHDYYLDLRTGEILLVSGYMDDAESEKLRHRVEESPDGYEPMVKGRDSCSSCGAAIGIGDTYTLVA